MDRTGIELANAVATLFVLPIAKLDGNEVVTTLIAS